MEAVALGVEAFLQRVPQVLLIVHQQLRRGRGVLIHHMVLADKMTTKK